MIVVCDEFGNLTHEGLFGDTEALDHRRQKCYWINPFKMKWMTGVAGQHGKESQLCATIAIPKRVDGVQFGEKVGRAGGEFFRPAVAQCIHLAKLLEDASQFTGDMLGVAEHAAAFADPYGPQSPCPAINILKDVPMDGQVVTDSPATARHRLQEATSCSDRLEAVQRFL